MKRTQPGEVLRAGLLKLNVITDNADNIGLLFQILREIERGGHSTMMGLSTSITTAHPWHVNLDCAERLWKRTLKLGAADLATAFG
jgi:hypothetical protein